MTSPPPAPGTYAVRLSHRLGVIFLVLAALNLLLFAFTQQPLNAILGVMLCVLGVANMRGNAVVVVPTQARRMAPLGWVSKRFPIASLADLRFDDNKLVHVPTGARIAVLGWNVNGEDVQRLRAAVELAGVGSAAPPPPPPGV